MNVGGREVRAIDIIVITSRDIIINWLEKSGVIVVSSIFSTSLDWTIETASEGT